MTTLNKRVNENRKLHIVSVVGRYYPDFAPGGMIINNVLQELKSDFEIDVIAKRSSFSLKNKFNYDGINIFYVTEWNLLLNMHSKTKFQYTSDPFLRLFWILFLRIVQFNYLIHKIIRMECISKAYMRTIENHLNKIEYYNHIDILIPIARPFESVFACINFKKHHNNTILLPYQLDSFSNCDSIYESKYIRKIKEHNLIRKEIEMLQYSDKLFAFSWLLEHYKKPIFSNWNNKIIAANEALIKRPKLLDIKRCFNDGKIHLVYAGSLIKKYRNPQYLLELMTLLNVKNDIVLDLYHFGDCYELVDQYVKISNCNIINHGTVSSNEAALAMQSADILISIGNDSDMLPSKLFSYISTGKPIIHLYYKNEDAQIKILEQYNNALLLKIKSNACYNDALLLYNYCVQNKEKQMTFEQVEKKYFTYTPKYVASQFRQAIEQIIK